MTTMGIPFFASALSPVLSERRPNLLGRRPGDRVPGSQDASEEHQQVFQVLEEHGLARKDMLGTAMQPLWRERRPVWLK